jgi:hypothetical protein
MKASKYAFARRETQQPTSPLTAQFAAYNQHICRKSERRNRMVHFGQQRHNAMYPRKDWLTRYHPLIFDGSRDLSHRPQSRFPESLS